MRGKSTKLMKVKRIKTKIKSEELENERQRVKSEKVVKERTG